MTGERFRNQTAVIVGASSGMGRAVARLVSGEGGQVRLVARSVDALRAVAGDIGPSATFAGADMTDAYAMRQAVGDLVSVEHLLVTAISGELSRRDVIGALDDVQLERSFDRMRGYVRAVQAVLPKFSSTGSMTFWCGASAVRPPSSGFSLLAAENASVGGFVRALALELAPIRVNAIMAGVVDTPIHAHQRESVREWAERALPVARLGLPDDIAQAAAFLMTNRYATGQTMTVDGGFSLI